MKIILLFLFFAPFTLCAQEEDKDVQMDSTFTISLGHNLRKLVCHAVIREPQTRVNKCIVSYRFDFYKLSDSTLLFSFVDSNSVYIINHYGFKFVDMNKDGYKDLLFVTDESAKAIEFWSVFLFNPKSKIFIYSETHSYFDHDY